MIVIPLPTVVKCEFYITNKRAKKLKKKKVDGTYLFFFLKYNFHFIVFPGDSISSVFKDLAPQHGLWRRSWGSTRRSKSGRRCSVLPGSPRTTPDYVAVNGTTHTVMQFPIDYGKHIGVENARFGNVPDGCGLYDVPNDRLLNGLIPGHASGTVGAADRLHVATALFGMTIIPSFLGHLGSEEAREV